MMYTYNFSLCIIKMVSTKLQYLTNHHVEGQKVWISYKHIESAFFEFRCSSNRGTLTNS